MAVQLDDRDVAYPWIFNTTYYSLETVLPIMVGLGIAIIYTLGNNKLHAVILQVVFTDWHSGA